MIKETTYMKRNIKKTQTHLETILSFVIFLSFLLVILFFINPVTNPKQSYASLDDVQTRIFNNLSIDYNPISLILFSSPVKDCFSIEEAPIVNGSFIVIDSSGNFLPSKVQSGKIFVKTSSDSEKKYYSFLLSDSLSSADDPGSNCDNLASSQYSFGVLGFEKAIFSKALKYFNSSYLSDYNGLRRKLGITKEFSFSVFDLTRINLYNESLSLNSALMGNVLSRDIPYILINETGGKQKIIFNLRVW
jgi:hypothetical protein